MDEQQPNPIVAIVTSRWFWVTGAALVVAVVALSALWYARHPHQSLWVDFAARRNPEASNGHVPRHASETDLGDLAAQTEE